MSQELIDTLPTHPLRRRGAARRLYAGGLGVQLLGWVALLVLALGVGKGSSAVGFVAPFSFVGPDALGALLRRRAWWHVPLRNAGSIPDRIELAYWTLLALGVAVVSTVLALRQDPDTSMLWVLFAFTIVFGALARDRQPDPEPAGVWWFRAAPMYTAAAAILIVGTVSGVIALNAAIVAGVAAACLLVVTRLVAARRHPSDA